MPFRQLFHKKTTEYVPKLWVLFVFLCALIAVVNYAQKGEKRMKYEEFCKEFKEGVLTNKRWNIKEKHYKFYPKGFASDDEQENRWVRITNEKYYQRNV